MARLGKWAKLWVGGYGLTTYANAIEPSRTHDELEAGGYGQDKNYLAGRADGGITINGFFDDATGATHEALKTISTDTEIPITVAFGNNAAPAVGDVAACLSAEETSYTTNPDLNGLIAVNATFKPKNDPLEYGVLLADASVTANGNQSSHDHGSGPTSNGGAGYLHITGLSAGDTITVKIQDSPDDSAWADLITFTLDGTAIGGERIEVSGDVDRYVRASYTVTGASISFPIAVAFIRY